MWIMTKYGILMPSEIPMAHRHPAHPEWDLQVRARERGALTQLKRDARRYGYVVGPIIATPQMDYEFRVYVQRGVFAELMMMEILNIRGAKFKPTTEHVGGGGPDLHHLYNAIWYIVARHYGSIPDPIERPAPRKKAKGFPWERGKRK